MKVVGAILITNMAIRYYNQPADPAVSSSLLQRNTRNGDAERRSSGSGVGRNPKPLVDKFGGVAASQ